MSGLDVTGNSYIEETWTIVFENNQRMK